MKKRISIVTFSFLAVTLLVGGVIYSISSKPVLADSNSIPNSDSPIVQTEPNSVLRGSWNLVVKDITFFTNGNVPDKKAASITLSLENSQGKEKSFLPKGYISAVVGESGKVYQLEKQPIDIMYIKSESARKNMAAKQGKPFYPGEFQLVPHFDVDSSEKNLSKIVYVDENGTQVEVQIKDITPTIHIPDPNAK